MLDINLLLAHFWANADIIYTTENVEICLLNDNEIEMELVLLKRDETRPLDISLIALMDLEDFIRLFEITALADLEKISTETLLRLMAEDELEYKVIEALY